MREKRFSGAFSVGVATAMCVGFAYCFPALFLMLGGSLDQISSICLILLSIGAAVWGAARLLKEEWWIVLSGVLFLLIVPALLAGVIMDTSFDGQEYHYSAIDALANGWNPYYQAFPDSLLSDVVRAPIWSQHYPIGSWMIVALEKAAGVPLEQAKGFALALLLASGLITASVLLRMGVATIPALATGFLAAANPIALAQVFTRMNDGVLASCILIIVSLAALAVSQRNRAAFLAIIPVMILALNLKFSAIPILVAICLFICLAVFALRGMKQAAIAASYLAGIGILGIFAIGYAPYTNNLLNFGHPFYPIMGAGGAYDIMTANTPQVIESHNSIQAFWVSLFSETHQGYGTYPSLKIPFTVSLAEIRAAGGVDTRIAGFGPLFSGVFLLAFTLALISGVRGWANRKARGFLLGGAGLLFLALVFPENWWARYVPQLWLVPISVAIACFLLPEKRIRIAAFALVGVMSLNAGLVLFSSSYLAFSRHLDAMRQAHSLASSGEIYEVDFGTAMARSEVFRNVGVKFSVVTDIVRSDCQSVETISAYGPDREGGTICRLMPTVEQGF
jgi:hypothetical protein